MSETWTDAERDSYFAPEDGDYEEVSPPVTDDNYEEEYVTEDDSDYSILDAPDYALFIKHKRTERGQEYEKRVASMLKAMALTAFRNGQMADGCAILHYGPSFAKKAGDLTDISPATAKAIDLLTTPDNPWVGFAAVGVPLLLQFFRNHEAEATTVKKTWREVRAERKRMKAEGLIPPKREGRPFTLRIGKRSLFTVRVKFPTPKLVFYAFQSQTKHPRVLTDRVLSDPKLVRALEKEGITVIKKRNVPDA